MRCDAYSNSEITDAIISVISNKYDRCVIYRRLVRGEPWQNLIIITKESKRHYERLCSKVYKKLKETENVSE